MKVSPTGNRDGLDRVGRKTPCDRGFTLVELVVTLVIIGALAAVSAPLFFNVGSFQQSGFYHEVLATVRYAQKHAVASGCAVEVQIAANSVALHTAANAAGCPAGPYVEPVIDPSSPGNGFTRSAPSGLTLSAVPVGTFVFCPLGNVGAGGACTGAFAADITVTAGARAFTVYGQTGLVR